MNINGAETFLQGVPNVEVIHIIGGWENEEFLNSLANPISSICPRLRRLIFDHVWQLCWETVMELMRSRAQALCG
jgi:hypothetical protein